MKDKQRNVEQEPLSEGQKIYGECTAAYRFYVKPILQYAWQASLLLALPFYIYVVDRAVRNQTDPEPTPETMRLTDKVFRNKENGNRFRCRECFHTHHVDDCVVLESMSTNNNYHSRRRSVRDQIRYGNLSVVRQRGQFEFAGCRNDVESSSVEI